MGGYRYESMWLNEYKANSVLFDVELPMDVQWFIRHISENYTDRLTQKSWLKNCVSIDGLLIGKFAANYLPGEITYRGVVIAGWIAEGYAHIEERQSAYPTRTRGRKWARPPGHHAMGEIGREVSFGSYSKWFDYFEPDPRLIISPEVATGLYDVLTTRNGDLYNHGSQPSKTRYVVNTVSDETIEKLKRFNDILNGRSTSPVFR